MTFYRWYDITEYEITVTNSSVQVKGQQSVSNKNRMFRSPLVMMLTLDVQHIAAANRLLTCSDSFLRKWSQLCIRTRRLSFLINFCTRLLYITLMLIYDMDRRWITKTGGKSDLLETGIYIIYLYSKQGTDLTKQFVNLLR